MNRSSSSIRPTELISCRCVPSPQSISSRSPPRLTSVAGSPRRGLGEEPAVPRKRTSRSIGPLCCLAGFPGEVLVRSQLNDLTPCRAAGGADQPHRVGGGAAALGRAARVEDLEAVAGLLVQGHV